MTLTTPDIDYQELRALARGQQRRPGPPVGAALAVSYLRVSTKDQAKRNGLDEGLSLPAQRKANARKAEALGAVIVKEFIEPGESAKTANRRALQEMLDFVAANPVRYCIINKVDRLARNRLDDAIIHAALRDAGVALVSVNENIDETPSGMLMHGIMASIAEFYSLNLGQEVTKGMIEKAEIGGTPTKAPLGYLNVRTIDPQGHEIRTVQVDPERADLVRFAFTAYATGNWSLSKLATELRVRGLTTRITPKRAAQRISTTSLHNILTNPYYKGVVTFRGVAYPGSHTALVDSDTWEQVQTVLDVNNQAGDRPQKHDHYLKGTLYCTCGAKLMLEHVRNHQGVIYPYFTCMGRRLKTTTCGRQAMLVDRIERLVEDHYATVSLTAADVEQIRIVLHTVFDKLGQASDRERQDLTTQRDRLESERRKLIQAHYAGAIPVDLLKEEQDRIGQNLDLVTRRLDQLTNGHDDAKAGLDQLLTLLHDARGLYLRCTPAERRMLNRVIFTKITIDEDGHSTNELRHPVEVILNPELRTAGAATRLGNLADQHVQHNAQAQTGSQSEPSPRIQAGQGSNFSSYVELKGLEPSTP
jgi:DNA invertase Pin-like site-specific DNA recombinase